MSGEDTGHPKLSEADDRVLVAIRELTRDGITATETAIADKADLPIATVWRCLAHLSDIGFIRKARADVLASGRAE